LQVTNHLQRPDYVLPKMYILSIMTRMLSVSATDAKQRLAALLDAAQREPVVIRRQKREVAVLLSRQEYDRLRALNADEFQQFCDRVGSRAAARGLTRSKLTKLLAADAQRPHRHR
jgi:prevent-host-death family protein